jgi:hypothetical protein
MLGMQNEGEERVMRARGRYLFRSGLIAAVGALTAGAAGYAVPAVAAPHPAHVAAPTGVSAEAALSTPELNKTGTALEVIRQIVQCGNTMYAVGKFTSISQGGAVFSRNNIFSFTAAAPYKVSSWAPNVNGEVNSIAFNGSNCADAYIGGQFTSVNGKAAKNIAEIDTTTGGVVPAFGANASNTVYTLLAVKGHLLAGGFFSFINGTKNPYLASLNPATGKDDGFVHLNISGTYHFCAKGGSPCTPAGNRSQVYNQQLSHNGKLDLVEGRFTSVGGLARQQIFMLDLSGSKATVTGWTSPEWDGSNPTADPYFECWPTTAFYIRAAAWSPGDSTVYIATTGYHPAQNLQTGLKPRTGLCDAVAAFPATPASVTHTWIEYSGCDSYYSVAADAAAVYAAGDPRWADNSSGCNEQGAGAVPDEGMAGLDPATGTAARNTGGTGLYTMTRANADGMLITGAGLWIGSTNRYTVNKCGDLTGPPGHNSADHAGICLLPY